MLGTSGVCGNTNVVTTLQLQPIYFKPSTTPEINANVAVRDDLRLNRNMKLRRFSLNFCLVGTEGREVRRRVSIMTTPPDSVCVCVQMNSNC